MLAGKTVRQIRAPLGSAAIAQIKRAGTAGLRLRLSGVDGKEHPASVVAVS